MYTTSTAFLLLLAGLAADPASSPTPESPAVYRLEAGNESTPPNVSAASEYEGAADSHRDANPDLRSLPFGKADTKNIGNYGAPGSAHYFPDPTRSSGVIVFFDDGAGTSIGVVATESSWEQFDEKGWELHNRFWQEADWCRDVTGFAWSEDGRYLFVATCDIYGSGNVYQLNLKKRQATVIFPREADASVAGHCRSTHIEAIGKDSIAVSARDYSEGDKILARVELPFMSEESFDSASGKVQPPETNPDGNSANNSRDR
jgi:hypothetical protein